jgi:flavin-dependent dehydrogenase
LVDKSISHSGEIISAERPGDGYYGKWVAPHLFRWRKRQPGYVYVVHFGEGVYKIGKATDVERRRRSFGEHELAIVLYDWANHHSAEQALHRRYRHRKIYGELFKLTPDDLLDIHYYWPSSCVWSGREWLAK